MENGRKEGIGGGGGFEDYVSTLPHQGDSNTVSKNITLRLTASLKLFILFKYAIH